MSDDTAGFVRWFGPTWFAPVNDPAAQIDTPVGDPCEHGCGNAIVEGQRGITIPYPGWPELLEIRISFHLECWMYEIGASVARGVVSTSPEEGNSGAGV